jgi:2-oxo-4-hydroxy-4-carboxy-5-ureidoimidazoline decarboxylase
MTTNKLSLDRINAADRAGYLAALGDLYEHSPWVVEAAGAARPYPDFKALEAALRNAVEAAGPERQDALIKAHPDLGGKAARAGTLTPDSAAEQASAGLDRLSDAEFERFHRLNDAYRAKFGFPFIVSVRRHTRDSILRQFERRLTNDMAAERAAALGEIFRIVALRLGERIDNPAALKVHGRLSTHVLDTHGGRPAAGIVVELIELSENGERRTVTRTVTNADGRTDQPLIGGRPIPIGRYELQFAIGDYFAQAGAPLADPPFLDLVPVRFAVAEPEGNYHVPLLVTPWSYATYRGS